VIRVPIYMGQETENVKCWKHPRKSLGTKDNWEFLFPKRKEIMSQLQIKTNIENGDLPEQLELFDGHSVEKLHKVIDRKIKILEDSNKLQEYCKTVSRSEK